MEALIQVGQEMTPERLARIRKSFTTADIDDLCDTVEKLTKQGEMATKILTSILTRCPQPSEEVDDTIREALDCLTGW